MSHHSFAIDFFFFLEESCSINHSFDVHEFSGPVVITDVGVGVPPPRYISLCLKYWTEMCNKTKAKVQFLVILTMNKKKSVMNFVYRVLWILKAVWIVLSETINILRNLPPPPKKRGMPPIILPYIYVIAPSSDHSFLSLNLPFKLMSGVRILHFSKDWWKFFQIHQYYAMAIYNHSVSLLLILRY